MRANVLEHGAVNVRHSSSGLFDPDSETFAFKPEGGWVKDEDALVLGAPRVSFTYTGTTPDGPEPTRLFAQLVVDETDLVLALDAVRAAAVVRAVQVLLLGAAPSMDEQDARHGGGGRDEGAGERTGLRRPSRSAGTAISPAGAGSGMK